MSAVSVHFAPALKRPVGLQELLQLPTGTKIVGTIGGNYEAQSHDGQPIRLFRLRWHWRRGGKLFSAVTLWGGYDRTSALSSFAKHKPEAIAASIVEEVKP